MSVDVRKLTNANVYFDGASYLGKVEEVTLPDISIKQAEHKALGMHAMIELPTGMDKMELKMKWSSITPQVMRKVANGYKSYTFQVRSSLDSYDANGRVAQESYVVYFRGTPKNIPNGSFKQHDNVEAETNFTVSYIKLEIGGSTIYEVDALANIYRVDGVDLLATFRANLGV